MNINRLLAEHCGSYVLFGNLVNFKLKPIRCSFTDKPRGAGDPWHDAHSPYRWARSSWRSAVKNIFFTVFLFIWKFQSLSISDVYFQVSVLQHHLLGRGWKVLSSPCIINVGHLTSQYKYLYFVPLVLSPVSIKRQLKSISCLLLLMRNAIVADAFYF